VTRFEHSVGAFLLVRTVGASLEEQIAALLHDISHTTLSHVIDWALSKPGEGSFHEVHKSRYIKTTQLPRILDNHGFGNLRPLDEELFPLVEMPSPHLCADRLDYSLRDAVGFGKLPLEEVQRLYAALKAFPDASNPQRIFMLEDQQLALALARAYLEIDRDVWSNPAHIDMYKRTGKLIGDMVRRGSVNDEDLWKLSDEEFWELLRGAAAPGELASMKRLESEGLPEDVGLSLPQGTKIRTIDPDIYLPATNQLLPLSIVYPEWEIERRKYICAREALRV
jgi:HD superfamily phosphohydrolase